MLFVRNGSDTASVSRLSNSKAGKDLWIVSPDDAVKRLPLPSNAPLSSPGRGSYNGEIAPGILQRQPMASVLSARLMDLRGFFRGCLAAVLAIPGHDGGLFALPEDQRRHWLKVFALVFRRDAFIPWPSDSPTFHQRALKQGRFYEECVALNLSNLVFGTVFRAPSAIASVAPTAPLQVREAALVFCKVSIHSLCRRPRTSSRARHTLRRLQFERSRSRGRWTTKRTK